VHHLEPTALQGKRLFAPVVTEIISVVHVGADGELRIALVLVRDQVAVDRAVVAGAVAGTRSEEHRHGVGRAVELGLGVLGVVERLGDDAVLVGEVVRPVGSQALIHAPEQRAMEEDHVVDLAVRAGVPHIGCVAVVEAVLTRKHIARADSDVRDQDVVTTDAELFALEHDGARSGAAVDGDEGVADLEWREVPDDPAHRDGDDLGAVVEEGFPERAWAFVVQVRDLVAAPASTSGGLGAEALDALEGAARSGGARGWDAPPHANAADRVGGEAAPEAADHHASHQRFLVSSISTRAASSSSLSRTLWSDLV